FQQQPEHLLFRLRQLSGQPGDADGAAVQVVVVDELVAVVPQQVGRGLGQPEADDVLAQLLQLRHKRGEVAVAGDDDEGVDVVLGVRQVHGVHAQADVGRVFAGLTAARDLNQLDGRLVQRRGVLGEPAPIGVGLFDDDLALLDEALDHLDDVEPVPALVQADADVLEIKKDGETALAVGVPGGFHSVLVRARTRAAQLMAFSRLSASLAAAVPGYFLRISFRRLMYRSLLSSSFAYNLARRRIPSASFSSAAVGPLGSFLGATASVPPRSVLGVNEGLAESINFGSSFFSGLSSVSGINSLILIFCSFRRARTSLTSMKWLTSEAAKLPLSLTATSSPFLLTSGPPESPGLIGFVAVTTLQVTRNAFPSSSPTTKLSLATARTSPRVMLNNCSTAPGLPKFQTYSPCSAAVRARGSAFVPDGTLGTSTIARSRLLSRQSTLALGTVITLPMTFVRYSFLFVLISPLTKVGNCTYTYGSSSTTW